MYKHLAVVTFAVITCVAHATNNQNVTSGTPSVTQVPTPTPEIHKCSVNGVKYMEDTVVDMKAHANHYAPSKKEALLELIQYARDNSMTATPSPVDIERAAKLKTQIPVLYLEIKDREARLKALDDQIKAETTKKVMTREEKEGVNRMRNQRAAMAQIAYTMTIYQKTVELFIQSIDCKTNNRTKTNMTP